MHRFHNNNLSRLYTANPEKHKQTIIELYAKYGDRLKMALTKNEISIIERTHSTWKKIGF